MKKNDQEQVRPFLRWPGGKRELAPSILPLCPPSFGTYFEPFVGSGAVFFALGPARANLSDINSELINAFTVVRDRVEDLIFGLEELRQNAKTYYRIRSEAPQTELDRAIRFTYLNRTAFNGIWRVNRDGAFNVPYGHRPRKDLVKAEKLRLASRSLSKVKLNTIGFEAAFKKVREGDLVYVDPPYTVKHENNGFRRYNEALFSWKDQETLASVAVRAAERGAHIIVSNASHPLVRALYRDFREVKLNRSSRLAADISARTTVKESLFVSS
jgi:DNA adenine methylase